MMMHVFLTGASGWLGSEVVPSGPGLLHDISQAYYYAE
jgi:hypothetical protein